MHNIKASTMKLARIYRVLEGEAAEALLVRQGYTRIGTYRDTQGKAWSEMIQSTTNPLRGTPTMHNAPDTTNSAPFPGGDTPRIYVASLADYNAGILHGRWIDATLGVEHIHAEVAAMLRESRYPSVTMPCPDCAADDNANECNTCHGARTVPSAEEWAIHDTDGFCGVKLSEWEDLANVADLADAIEEYGEAFATWFANESGDMDSIDTSRFRGAYLGHFDSLEDYAREYLADTGMFDNVNDVIQQYFDFEAFARDMRLDGSVWTADASEGGVHVFDNTR